MRASSEIAAWIADLRYEHLPAEVVEVTTRAHLDTIGVAAALLDGALTLNTFSDAAVQRPAAQDLLRKVTTVEDPGMKVVQTPVDEGYVEVSVATRHGRELVKRVTYPVGSSELPLPWHELVAKFRDCARGVLDGGRIERSIACLATLGQQSSLSDLIGTLTPA